MSDEPSSKELVQIALATSIVHFLVGSAVGYTLGVLGIVNPETTLIRFTLIFSSFWGLFGAGMTWKRNRSYIQMSYLEKVLEKLLGVENTAEKLDRYLDMVYFPQARHGSHTFL